MKLIAIFSTTASSQSLPLITKFSSKNVLRRGTNAPWRHYSGDNPTSEALFADGVRSFIGELARSEGLKFFAARMNKDMQMAQNLMSGNIFGEILNRQSEYVREMMKDYSDGTQSLVERGLQVAKDSATSLEERSDEAAQGIKSEAKRVAAE